MEEPRRKTRKFSDFAMNTDRDLSVFETKVILPPNEEAPPADVGTPRPATAPKAPELVEPAAGVEVTAAPSPDRKASSIAISARIPADVYLSMRRATRLREKQNDFIISALKREIASRE